MNSTIVTSPLGLPATGRSVAPWRSARLDFSASSAAFFCASSCFFLSVCTASRMISGLARMYSFTSSCTRFSWSGESGAFSPSASAGARAASESATAVTAAAARTGMRMVSGPIGCVDGLYESAAAVVEDLPDLRLQILETQPGRRAGLQPALGHREGGAQRRQIPVKIGILGIGERRIADIAGLAVGDGEKAPGERIGVVAAHGGAE